MAARLGVEPRQNESESFVLPLHHRAVENFSAADGMAEHVHGRRGISDFAAAVAGMSDDCRRREVGLPAVAPGAKAGAGDGIRTRNRLFTKQVLYH